MSAEVISNADWPTHVRFLCPLPRDPLVHLQIPPEHTTATPFVQDDLSSCQKIGTTMERMLTAITTWQQATLVCRLCQL